LQESQPTTILKVFIIDRHSSRLFSLVMRESKKNDWYFSTGTVLCRRGFVAASSRVTVATSRAGGSV